MKMLNVDVKMLNVQSSIKNYQCTIINSLGQVVYYNGVSNSLNHQSINIKQLKNGIYSLQITTNEGVLVKKFIKE